MVLLTVFPIFFEKKEAAATRPCWQAYLPISARVLGLYLIKNINNSINACM